MSSKTWAHHIDDLLEAVGRIRSYTEGMSRSDFETDQRTVDAVMHNFVRMGEVVRGLPEEVLAREQGIPWAEIRGLRNVLVHAYREVRLELVWKTIQEDLPPLQEKLHKMRQVDDDY